MEFVKIDDLQKHCFLPCAESSLIHKKAMYVEEFLKIPCI